MSLRLYLIVMALVSVCAFIAWLVVLFSIDPSKSGFLGYCLFYLTLEMTVLSSLTLFGTLLRVWFRKDQIVYKLVVRSLRQGVILSVLFLTALIFSGLNLLVWWVVVLLVFIGAVLELVLLGIE
jgi:hypothetical protein